MKSLLPRFRRLTVPLRWLVAPVGASLKAIVSQMVFLRNCFVRHSPFDALWELGKVSLHRASALQTAHALSTFQWHCQLSMLFRFGLDAGLFTREGAALDKHMLVATVQAPWKVCRRNACALVRLQVNACQLRQSKT